MGTRNKTCKEESQSTKQCGWKSYPSPSPSHQDSVVHGHHTLQVRKPGCVSHHAIPITPPRR